MGERGPLKLPSYMSVVDGTAAEPVATAASRFEPRAPAKPDHLVGTLSTLWDQIVPKLDRAGLITEVDGMAIELALRHYVAAMAASEQLADADGVTLYDEKNERAQKHPADAVFRMQSEMFLKFAGQLGLTFVSRARTPAAKTGDDGDENPFASPVG